MKKINLRGILNPMSDSEMKLARGGVDPSVTSKTALDDPGGGATGASPGTCTGKKQYDSCTSKSGLSGCCAYAPFVYDLYCRVPC